MVNKHPPFTQLDIEENVELVKKNIRDSVPGQSVWNQAFEEEEWSEALFAKLWQNLKAWGDAQERYEGPCAELCLIYMMGAAINAGDVVLDITPTISEDLSDEFGYENGDAGWLTPSNIMQPHPLRTKKWAWCEGPFTIVDALPHPTPSKPSAGYHQPSVMVELEFRLADETEAGK
jgi:hypothetical protein